MSSWSIHAQHCSNSVLFRSCGGQGTVQYHLSSISVSFVSELLLFHSDSRVQINVIKIISGWSEEWPFIQILDIKYVNIPSIAIY